MFYPTVCLVLEVGPYFTVAYIPASNYVSVNRKMLNLLSHYKIYGMLAFTYGLKLGNTISCARQVFCAAPEGSLSLLTSVLRVLIVQV